MAGCSQEPSIVGKWTGNLPNEPAVTLEFKDDKTVTLTSKQGPYGASLSGKYELDNKNLTYTFSKGSLTGFDPALRPQEDSVINQKLNKPFKLAYHFNKANEIALTFDGKTDIITRVVESSP